MTEHMRIGGNERIKRRLGGINGCRSGKSQKTRQQRLWRSANEWKKSGPPVSAIQRSSRHPRGRQRIVVCLIGFSAQHCERRRARRPVRTAADSDGRGSDCQGPWARSASGRRGGCWPCARTAGVWARAPRRARRDGRCRRRNTRAAEAAEPSLRVRLEGTRWPRGHAVDQEYSYPKRLSG